MTFRYFIVGDPGEPDIPRGLMALNRDKEAGRLDTMVFSHWSNEWESDPDAVGLYLFGDDSQDRVQEVSREAAERAATVIGTTIPPEAELMRLSDEAERQRAADRSR